MSLNTEQNLIQPSRRLNQFAFLLISVLLAAGILLVGYLTYRNFTRRYRAEVERQLSSIAELKVGELKQWRKERLGDAALIFENAAFVALVRRVVETPADTDAQRQLLDWMGKVSRNHQYDQAWLIDAQGVTRLSVPGGPQPLAKATLQLAEDVLRSGRVTFQDFYRNEHDGRVYLEVLVPILDEEKTGKPLGTLVLRIDPEAYLYPFIKRWPVPSRTAETLLIRREGEEVAFLNNLRFSTNAALKLRAPLTQTTLPAVQAARGVEGVMEGVNYRGRPVFAALRTVPDSPWALAAIMESEEAHGPQSERVWLLCGLVAALVFGVGAGAGLVWRNQRARYYQTVIQYNLRDITERKRAETALKKTAAELERSNKELEQFAYIASHDLQEPLRMVASYTQLLAKRYGDRLDQDAKDFIGFAVDGATRMQRLINDLLSYSRVQTHGKALGVVESHAALGVALANLSAAIQESGAIVTNDDLPRVRADHTQLVQLFQNLIGNALKFRGEFPPHVHVSAERLEGGAGPLGSGGAGSASALASDPSAPAADPSPVWHFSVRDNGIGIEPQYFERIFVIFQRLHGKAKYPGTGIGLALCKRIVERHGGSIWVESELGQGTTFHFTLPAQKEDTHER
jgi:signal transduction histidine kinase